MESFEFTWDSKPPIRWRARGKMRRRALEVSRTEAARRKMAFIFGLTSFGTMCGHKTDYSLIRYWRRRDERKRRRRPYG